MPLISIDDDLLAREAGAARNAGEQKLVHIRGEIAGLIPELMETLSLEGPYAYTILPKVHPDGRVGLPVLTTAEEIREAYRMIRGMSELLQVSVLTEIRGAWYTFQDSISRTRLRHKDHHGAAQTLAPFPTGKRSGITGELVWARKPREALGAREDVPPSPADRDPIHALVSGPPDRAEREQVFLLPARSIDGLRDNDAEAIVATLNAGVASAGRDYVNPTGTLVMLEGIEDHRSCYRAFFETFEVLATRSYRPRLVRLRRTAHGRAPPDGRALRRTLPFQYCRVPRPRQRRSVHHTHRPRNRAVADSGARMTTLKEQVRLAVQRGATGFKKEQ